MRTGIGVLPTLVFLFFLSGCTAYLKTEPALSPVQVPANLLYDDDCDSDIDCAVTQPIIQHWIDVGFVKIWGMVSSAPSDLGAPTMKVFQKYYGHEGYYSIGAWAPGCGLQNQSPWNVAVVRQFDAGDVCMNYASCGTVLRQSVANYAVSGGQANGLTYLITGPLSCEEEFRATLADSISPLTGMEMEKRFVNKFILMNSYVPSGSEYNCVANAAACSTFCSRPGNYLLSVYAAG